MPLVIDASISYRMIVQKNDQGKLHSAITDWIAGSGPLIAPSLWLYEMTNVVIKEEHFGNLTHEEVNIVFDQVHRFPVHLAHPHQDLSDVARRWSQRLRRANVYDSYYLALAESFSCRLYTMDKRLINAVGEDWVLCPFD